MSDTFGIFDIVLLRKNNNGNYFADIVLDKVKIKAYLSNKLIESGWLFSEVDENLKYYAFIQKVEDKNCAFIKQIVRFTNNTRILPMLESTSSIAGYIRSAKKQKNDNYYSALFYSVDYEDVFLKVRIFENVLIRNGIFEISEDAIIEASLTFDHEKSQHSLDISYPPEKAVLAYNIPKASLCFVEVIKTKNGANKFNFKTQMVNGISLLVSLWESDLTYFFDTLQDLNLSSEISCVIDFSKSNGWINYKLAKPTESSYDGLFLCVSRMVINGLTYLLFEYKNFPYFRVRISQDDFFNYGIYDIPKEASIALEIEKDTATSTSWKLKKIDKDIYPSWSTQLTTVHATIVSNWSSYDNKPDYITNITRNKKNYALTNHCVAKIEMKDVELLVIIPKQLLVKRGFRKVKKGIVLELEVLKVTLPLFSETPTSFLCANKVISEPTYEDIEIDDKVFAVRFVKQLESEKNKKYEFKIISNGETINFIDWNGVLSNIKNLEDYQFIIRSSEYKGTIQIKEIISARLK